MGPALWTPIKVLDGKDEFKDGVYELVLGAQVFALTKNRGEYQEITTVYYSDSDSCVELLSGRTVHVKAAKVG